MLDKRKVLMKILNISNDQWAMYCLGHGKWEKFLTMEKKGRKLTEQEERELNQLAIENARFEVRILQNLRHAMNSPQTYGSSSTMRH